MNDYVIAATSIHFSASKNQEYRQRALERFSVFAKFLQNNQLTNKTILAEDESPDEHSKVMKSDLTDEGFEVVKTSYDKWLRGIDKGKPISDTSLLEKALAKAREPK